MSSVDEMLSGTQVARVLGVSTATFYRLVAVGDFPRPDLDLGPRTKRWRRQVVDDFLRKQKQTRQ